MPRIRSIKPEIHQDEAIGDLSDSGFRLFVGLITQADDYGRLKGGLSLVNAQVWPHRPKPLEEVDGLLDELVRAGLIHRYEVGEKPYICLPSWSEHQRVSNAGKSRIPEPIPLVRRDSPRDSASRGGSRLDQGGDQGSGRGSKEVAASATTRPGDALAQRLERVTFARNAPSPEPHVVAKLRSDFPAVDLLAEADDFAHYWTDGPGGKKPLRDIVGAFRRQLTRNAKKAKPDPKRIQDTSPYEKNVQVIQV